MTVQLQSGTPLAEALSAAVQQKIVEIGWSSDGEDASPLSEYIVLMLVNGKTEQQITSELSGDLLGLGPEDESVKSFTTWMFAELERLGGGSTTGGGAAAGASATAGGNNGPSVASAIGSAIPSAVENGSTPDSLARHDDDMDDGMEGADGIPTGPKAMRHQKGRRPGGLFNQINKNMDRTSDPLRQPQNRNGQNRIQKHDPNRGPRQNFNMQGGPQGGPRHMQRGQQPPHMQNAYMNAAMGQQGPGAMGQQPGQFPGMMMTPEQQLQFLQMMEQQARMMGVLGPNGFMGGPPGAAGFPGQEQHGQSGRSLFDRVEQGGRGGHHGRKPHHSQHNNNQQQHSKPPAKTGDDMEMGEDGEGEESKAQEDTACKFGLRCTKADCGFAHPSPASDPNRPVSFVPGDKCAFGIACKNRKCVSSHPSPASGATKPAFEQQDCKFWPNCMNPQCPFKHPSNGAAPPCRFGAACTKPNCAFTHSTATLDVACKFNPCLNRHCPYKHEDGQQKGVFEHKTWTATGVKPHVSDRKFTNDEEGDEELIIPGQESNPHEEHMKTVDPEVLADL